MIKMPGKSFRGPLPAATEGQRALQAALERDVEELAGRIGERNLYRYAALNEAADFIEASLSAAPYRLRRQDYEVGGKICRNLEAQSTGAARAEEIVIVGAHYDTVSDCPGANDNGTGVAALLALARSFAARRFPRTVRFVAFTNEEPPFFQRTVMGSYVYARQCRRQEEKINAMLSLETIGCYSDEEGSQHFPFPFNYFYPSKGNFIAFIGNLPSRRLVRRVVGSFREGTEFPSEGAAVPSFITGAGWSDHWSFWQQGYPAVMVTDTALFRYDHYHEPSDTPDKIDFDRTARVVEGLEKVLEDLASDRREGEREEDRVSARNRTASRRGGDFF